MTTKGIALLLVATVCYSHATNECHNQPADIGFLLDESGSVGNINFKSNLAFVTNFVDVFDIGDTTAKISLYAFHQEMGNGFYFNCCIDKESFKSSINKINYSSGGEDFEKALAFAKNNMFQKSNGMRDFSVKILLFFTDGRSSVQDGGKLLHQLGVIVYAVGVGNGVDIEQLKKIATNDSYVFMVSNYGSLVGQISQNIRSKACDDLVNAPNPCFKNPQPCQNQGTCIPQTGAKYKCICPVGYTGHQCHTDINYCDGVICHNGGTCNDGLTDYTCTCADQFIGQHCEIDICKPFPSDVVFVIDSSTSFSQNYFNITKHFIQSTTEQWEIYQNGFQVAIISYSEFSHLELNFDITMDKLKFDDFVSKIDLKGGISEIHMGLNHARNLLYNKNRFVSGIPVKKYIILISDGLPSTPSAITTMSTQGMTILAVGVGEDVSHHYLSLIVGGSEKVFPYNNDRLWHYMMDALIDASCNFCKNSEEADVIFAVDTSNGWNHSDLATLVPTIISKIVAGIELGPTKTQIALITYATSSNIRFDFNKYNNESERLNLRRQLSSFDPSTSFNTNITDLVENVDHLLVDSKKGARLSAKKFLILFSNYQNNISVEDRNILDILRKSVEIFAVGLDQSDEKFTIMSEIASTSFHIGIDGGMSVNSIDTFIASLLEQFKTVHCYLP